MPATEETQKAFKTIQKKAKEISKSLRTTVGAIKQRNLIEESLDKEITFGLAGVTLTVDGTASVDLLNKHTFKADDKTKKDPDGILGGKPEEDVDGTLGPQLRFRRDQTWLKYKLEAEAEATVDRTFFDASTSGAVVLGWYRGHDSEEKVREALLRDLSQPRFALVESDVKNLKLDEALTLHVRGKLCAGFSFEWSDFFTSNLSAFGEMLDEDETFSVKTEVGATASVTAAVEDDFILVFTCAPPERLRVAVKKANEKSLHAKAGVSSKVGFTNPEDVAKAIKGAKDGLIGPHVTQITEILDTVTKFDDLSPEQKALVDQVRNRLRVVDDALDKLEGLRKRIAGLDERLDKEITTWAKAKIEFGFTFEYNRVKTQLALVQATFPTAQLGNFHDALIRRDLAILLGQVSETSAGVKIEKFLNQTSLKINRSFGFSLGSALGRRVRGPSASQRKPIGATSKAACNRASAVKVATRATGAATSGVGRSVSRRTWRTSRAQSSLVPASSTIRSACSRNSSKARSVPTTWAGSSTRPCCGAPSNRRTRGRRLSGSLS